jgi:phage-related tail fiber protein
MKEGLGCRGDVEADIEFRRGEIERIAFRNTILRTGREALALCLANRIGNDFDFFISRMLFGDGGVVGTSPKTVPTDRNGLFGTARVNKPVVANIDPNNPSQLVLTSVVSFDEGNGFALNEMALKMNNGDLYSMATFPSITKTNEMQITWRWRLSFI